MSEQLENDTTPVEDGPQAEAGAVAPEAAPVAAAAGNPPLSATPGLAAVLDVPLRVTVEIEGGERPACVIDTISRYYPE